MKTGLILAYNTNGFLKTSICSSSFQPKQFLMRLMQTRSARF